MPRSYLKERYRPSMYLRSFAVVVALFSSSVFAQALAVTVQWVNVPCFGGNTGSATANVTGGSPPYSYSWTTGATTAGISGLMFGTYTVTVRDSLGATLTRSANITSPTQIFVTTSVLANVTCNGGNNGSAQAGASGGAATAYTYSWAPSGGSSSTGLSLSAGTYTVTATDVNNCSKSKTVTIVEPPPLQANTTKTDVSCFGGNNGSATVNVTGGGTPGYTYSWSSGGGTAATASGRTAGNYTVTITDANSCTYTRLVNVAQPAAALSSGVIVTNIACHGASTGAINLIPTGGTTPYTFDWGGGVTTEDRSGLSPGSYSVAITDAKGCTASRTSSIAQPASAVSGSVVTTPPSCFGGNNGMINLTALGGTPPLSFAWASGATTEDRTFLSAGPQSVVITDANACSTTVNTTVTQPAELVVVPSAQTNVSCHGGTNGSLTVAASGGTGPLTYLWSPSGGTDVTASALTAGAYSVNVTDQNNCTATRSLTVTEPASLTLQTSKQDTCPGESTGAASVNASGGTAPFSYDWSPGMPAGEGTSSITALGSGAVSVSVVDSLGCQAAESVTIADRTSPPQAQSQSLTTAEDTALALTLGATDVCGAASFAVTAQPRHGTLTGTAPALTYSPEANYFGADDFAFTVSSAVGTSVAASVSIAVTPVNDLPVASSQVVTTALDTVLPITLEGTDVEGTSLTFSIVDAPLHGALSGTAPALTYAPTAGFAGDDTFTFTAHDGTDSSMVATISIVVAAPDAGVDAGFEDAGVEPVDAGMEPSDAGTAVADAGMVPTDVPNPVGCGCTTPPGAMLAWSLGVLLLRRRRAR